MLTVLAVPLFSCAMAPSSFMGSSNLPDALTTVDCWFSESCSCVSCASEDMVSRLAPMLVDAFRRMEVRRRPEKLCCIIGTDASLPPSAAAIDGL